MSSTESAARFIASYQGRGAHLSELYRHTWYVAKQFREIVLEHVSRYTPRHTAEIRRRLEDDYGSVCKRRVHRHLAALVRSGAIKRTEDGYVLAVKR